LWFNRIFEVMMTKTRTQREAPQDEYLLDTSVVRHFIQRVRQAIVNSQDVNGALESLHPHFVALLADQSWLPEELALPYAESGMGGGIASWLLFRAADRSLSLISLVVPPGSETPVHDHLAWGLVGLYRGEQQETVYARQGMAAHRHHGPEEKEHANLTVAQINELKPGDIYRLIPPDGDIHSVKTTSDVPSISIHLLTNDIGCIVRHAFDPEKSTARAFRSGYSNMACSEEE
jgi:predicted metal-dependent enzyme (double-stranded beta helix superfamily)